jgi:predicted transcriptional regulator of viral defense system
MQLSASVAILTRLAQQHRLVLSRWRALILVRRATIDIPPEQRRWRVLPRQPSDVQPILRQMVRRGEISPIANRTDIFAVTAPYAQTRLMTEEEVIGEIHPYSALGHVSALVFHHLTDQFPKELTLVVPKDGRGGLLPLGTDASDWEGIPLVGGQRPPRVLGRPIDWLRLSSKRVFGMQEYRPRGYPVRVTTPERTLLDGLLDPERCGGIENVLRAWVRASPVLDLDELVAQVELFDVQVLRQRVGFILDQLALQHPASARWQRDIQRGGSSKLLAAAPYAPTYDERWALSLNGPVDVLREGAE